MTLSLSFPCFDLLSCRRRKAGILPSLEDLLFYTIAEGQEKIPAHKFTTVSPSAAAEASVWVIHTNKMLLLQDVHQENTSLISCPVVLTPHPPTPAGS